MKSFTRCFRLFSCKRTSQTAFLRSNAQFNQEPLKFQGNGPLEADQNSENKDYYSSLRIYQNHSWFELMNLLAMTTVCSNDFFVDNCHKFYALGRKIFGNPSSLFFGS